MDNDLHKDSELTKERRASVKVELEIKLCEATRNFFTVIIFERKKLYLLSKVRACSITTRENVKQENTNVESPTYYKQTKKESNNFFKSEFVNSILWLESFKVFSASSFVLF